MTEWLKLGAAAPKTLQDARLQAHFAVQIAAGLGTELLEPRPDWSHTALCWSSEHRALVGEAVGQKPRLQCGLRLHDLTLLLLGEEGQQIDAYSLHGQTLQDGFAWLNKAVPPHLKQTPDKAFAPRASGLPQHPVQTNEPFSTARSESFVELAKWYENAAHILGTHQKNTPGASPIRCWPHHFDIAFLAVLDPDKDPEAARSVGVGLSPGDGSYSEPYWYVTPWPSPKDTALPPLSGGGAWHTDGFLAGVLTGSTVVEDPNETTQKKQVGDFLQNAITESLRLIGYKGIPVKS